MPSFTQQKLLLHWNIFIWWDSSTAISSQRVCALSAFSRVIKTSFCSNYFHPTWIIDILLHQTGHIMLTDFDLSKQSSPAGDPTVVMNAIPSMPPAIDTKACIANLRTNSFVGTEGTLGMRLSRCRKDPQGKFKKPLPKRFLTCSLVSYRIYCTRGDQRNRAYLCCGLVDLGHSHVRDALWCYSIQRQG